MDLATVIKQAISAAQGATGVAVETPAVYLLPGQRGYDAGTGHFQDATTEVPLSLLGYQPTARNDGQTAVQSAKARVVRANLLHEGAPFTLQVGAKIRVGEVVLPITKLEDGQVMIALELGDFEPAFRVVRV